MRRLTNEEGNSLRDAVASEFTAEGSEPNYEPNDYGFRLEDLIDQVAGMMEGFD